MSGSQTFMLHISLEKLDILGISLFPYACKKHITTLKKRRNKKKVHKNIYKHQQH